MTRDGPLPFVGMRALVADDTETNRLVLKAMLAGAGMDIVLVEDGAQAVEAWSPESFDVVLLDIAMPRMDGICALRAIRAKAAAAGASRPPAIAITANTMTHQIEGYFAAGFDAHVAKPFGSEQLRRQVADVLQAAPARTGA